VATKTKNTSVCVLSYVLLNPSQGFNRNL